MEADAGMLGREALEDFPGAVLGAVIDDDELAAEALREGGLENLSETALDDGSLVVDGDQDAD
jgi:hypothetical protein